MADNNPYYVSGMPDDVTKDHVVKAHALNGFVKAVAIRSTEACETARKTHNTTNAVTAALGRFITGSLLISENMKNEDDTQTTIIKSNGPIRGMTCVVDSNFNAKAYPIENAVETTYHKPGKINVGEAVGEGMLTVIRDIGLRDPYVGSVELLTGEIAEDFTYYLAKSEQTPSIVALGVLIEDGKVKHAGGLMVQLMPGATEKEIAYLEDRASGFPDITYLLEEGFSPAQIIDLFLGDPDVNYLMAAPAAFKCNCSKERLRNGLITLGKNDLQELSEDPNGIDTECHFCNSKYHFEPNEIKALIGEIS